jgi:hypothetical protein
MSFEEIASLSPHELPFSAQERDIDLVILEQLHLSPAFVEWLAGRVNVLALLFIRHGIVSISPMAKPTSSYFSKLRKGE